MTETEAIGAESSQRIWRHPILGDLAEARPITITVDGREIIGREGDVIAAVLLAAGVRACRITGRSGERRGPFCAVGRCPDCMMIVDGQVNVRTCITPARDGMRIETQHGTGGRGSQP